MYVCIADIRTYKGWGGRDRTVGALVSVGSRIGSKRDRTVSMILPRFQQKSVHIVITDPFSRGPGLFDLHIPTPCMHSRVRVIN
jgi:hypothetical protein